MELLDASKVVGSLPRDEYNVRIGNSTKTFSSNWQQYYLSEMINEERLTQTTRFRVFMSSLTLLVIAGICVYITLLVNQIHETMETFTEQHPEGVPIPDVYVCNAARYYVVAFI